MLQEWIGRLTGKKRNAYIEMVKKGLWRDHYSERKIVEYLRERAERRRQERTKIFGPIRHKTYTGPDKDIDRLSMAKRMANRQDNIMSFTPNLGIAKRRRHLLDGTILTYKRMMNSDVGRITATTGRRTRIRQNPWERFVREYIHQMDAPDAMEQIQPAFLVWEDYNNEDLWYSGQPCGMLVTNKFAPPYYYIPRLDEDGNEIFTVTDHSRHAGFPGENEIGSGWDYEFVRPVIQRITYKSYMSSGMDDRSFIHKIYGNCYRDSCGEYDVNYDDATWNYYGHDAPDGKYAYKYWYYHVFDYHWDNYCTGEDAQRQNLYANNWYGMDYTQRIHLGAISPTVFAEYKEHSSVGRTGRLYFDGDCGYILLGECNSYYEYADWYRTGIWSLYYSPIDWDDWPEAEEGVDYWDITDWEFYMHPWESGIAIMTNSRGSSCQWAMTDQYKVSGIEYQSAPGQILKLSNGENTKEWIAFVVEKRPYEYSVQYDGLSSQFYHYRVRTSRGLNKYFGAYGRTTPNQFRSACAPRAATLWDCKSPSSDHSGPEKIVAVYEIQMQDGTVRAEGDSVWTGTVPAGSSGTWIGGDYGNTIGGNSFIVHGTDAYEAGFILTGSGWKFMDKKNNSPTMSIVSAGKKATCLQRNITPDLSYYFGGEIPMRVLGYSFYEEKALTTDWPANFPERGFFQYGIVPVKISYKPSNWTRYIQRTGRVEETHGVDVFPEEEVY